MPAGLCQGVRLRDTGKTCVKGTSWNTETKVSMAPASIEVQNFIIKTVKCSLLPTAPLQCQEGRGLS